MKKAAHLRRFFCENLYFVISFYTATVCNDKSVLCLPKIYNNELRVPKPRFWESALNLRVCALSGKVKARL